jgi:hypothetical protein
MRTLTESHWSRPTLTRTAALGLAAAAALTLAGCGGGGSGTVAKTTGKPSGASNAATSATPSAPQTFNPDDGPTQDPATLPKTCNGLVTDADIQLTLGQPLVGGDFYTAYQPLPTIKQTKKVKCQYGTVLDAAGKYQSDLLEVQMATYADAASAKGRASSTVAGMAAQNEQFKQIMVSGHPASYVTEANDAVLVMYDGNRTFLITIQNALVKGDAAEPLAIKLADALYRHTTPNAGQPATPTAGASGGTPAGSATPGAATPTAAASS